MIYVIALSLLNLMRGQRESTTGWFTSKAGRVVDIAFSKWPCITAMAAYTTFLLQPLEMTQWIITFLGVMAGFALLYGVGWMLTPAVHGDIRAITEDKHHWLLKPIDLILCKLRPVITFKQAYRYGVLWLGLRWFIYGLPLCYFVSYCAGISFPFPAILLGLQGLILYCAGWLCQWIRKEPEDRAWANHIAQPFQGALLAFVLLMCMGGV